MIVDLKTRNRSRLRRNCDMIL